MGSLAGIMPGKYFSTGGDEVNMNCYNSDQQTKNDLAASGKTIEDAVRSFVQQ